MITNKVQATYNIKEQDNPFPGLRAFGVEESHLFFGREGQSEIILEYLAKNHFAAVTGASGSGKSSLIYCGLVPILFGGFITGAGSNWRIIASRPGNQPVRNLAEALSDSEIQSQPKKKDIKDVNRNLVYALLRRNSFGLVDAIAQMDLKKGENLLLIVDQFEELFRFKESRDDRVTTINETEAFIKLLVNAIHQRKLPIYVVLTMRSDFVGECSQFQELTSLINDSNFLVPQMTREDFSNAILGPTAVATAEMDPQLYQEILNSISEGSDQLPVLQHAMMRTWEYWKKYNESATPLRLRDYEAAGKMENALSMHANEAYEVLSEEGKRICKSMFRTLTEQSSDNKGIRHPATVKEIADVAQANLSDVIEVINEFRSRGRSFVTPAENVELTEHTVIDISHESLMRVWDRLKGWVEEESNSVQMYMRLSEASSLYQLGKTGLWRPPDLQLALNWRKNQQPSLAWARKYNPAFEKVIVFLDASEKKFLQEEQNKIKLQRRTLNRTRRFATFMGIASIILLLAMAFAFNQKKIADDNRKIAQSFASVMEQEKNVAVEDRDVKELERLRALIGKDSAERAQMRALLQLNEVQDEAEEAYILADIAQQQSVQAQQTTVQAQRERQAAQQTAERALEGQSLATQAVTAEMRKRMLTTAQTMAIKAMQTQDKTVQSLLALQGFKFNKAYSGPANQPDIYKGLFSALANNKGRDFNSLKGHDGSVKSVAFLASRNILYSSGADGNIFRWDLDQANPKPQLVKHNNFPNASLAISSNGRWLACGTGTSTIQIFSLNQPNSPPNSIEAHKGAVTDLEFIQGQDILISTGSDKSIIAWNLLTGGKQIISTNDTRIRAICTSGDGKYVYGGTDDGKLIRWSISDGNSKTIYENGGQTILSLTLNSRGSRLALGDKNGKIVIIDPNSSKRLSSIKGHNARIQDIAYSPDNTQLATISLDGTIRIWNANKLSDTPVVITEHECWGLAVTFSQDGKQLITSSQIGKVFYWSTRNEYMAAQMCGFASRNFTDQEWDIHVGMDIDYQKTCPER